MSGIPDGCAEAVVTLHEARVRWTRGSASEQLELLMNTRLSPEAQRFLLERRGPWVPVALAQNKALDPAVAAEMIARGAGVAVLARNPVLGHEVQESLLGRVPIDALLANPRLSPKVRAQYLEGLKLPVADEAKRRVSTHVLAGRGDLATEEIRALLGLGQHLPRSLERQLLLELAANDALSDECVEILLEHVLGTDLEWLQVQLLSELVARSIPGVELLAVLLRERPGLRGVLGAHPALTRMQQLELAAHGELVGLASNPSLCTELQSMLVRESQGAARSALCRNPGLLPELQELLFTDPSTHEDLGANVALDPELLAQIAGRAGINDAVWENPGLVLDEHFPVVPLASRMPEIQEMARAAGVEAATFAALRWSWEGTVGELLEACRELGPDGG